jgi:hypothetical protein
MPVRPSPGSKTTFSGRRTTTTGKLRRGAAPYRELPVECGVELLAKPDSSIET